MGAADIVPGVSGGTMAFITGIYDQLLSSIRAVDVHFVCLLLRGDVGSAWRHIDGGFLLALLAGIATSIFSLARLIGWLLLHHPVPLWAFFFGLILASALVLLSHVKRWYVPTASALCVGLGISLLVALSSRLPLADGPVMVFLAGFLAICAMILPGISGSFILVLLGMYSPVLVAIHQLDSLFLLVFAGGAACGLMAFSRLLHYLLHRFHQQTMALLTGFLLGSLVVVWPWKQAVAWVIDSSGESKPARLLPVSPAEFSSIAGQDPQLLVCLVLMALGFALVWVIESRFGGAARAP